jgi:hypothetical protein
MVTVHGSNTVNAIFRRYNNCLLVRRSRSFVAGGIFARTDCPVIDRLAVTPWSRPVECWRLSNFRALQE